MRKFHAELVCALVVIASVISCSNPENTNTSDTVKSDWFGDVDFSYTENSVLYNGATNDEIFWYSTKYTGTSVKYDFDVTLVQQGNSSSLEYIFIIGGNGLYNQNTFWDNGLIINYSDRGSYAESWIRRNGIYTNSEFLFKNYPQIFTKTDTHHYEIIFNSGNLSFLIDGVLIIDSESVPNTLLDGYFGVANYWGNDHSFRISNFTASNP